MPGDHTNDSRLDLHDLQVLGEAGLVRRYVEHRELRFDLIREQVEDPFPVT